MAKMDYKKLYLYILKYNMENAQNSLHNKWYF